MSFERSSGILLHPTSLPGGHGIGDLGDEAFRWVEFLADSGQRLWQLLPLGPTGFGDSPYQCFSAFAGNPYLISLDRLHAAGLLDEDDLVGAPADDPQTVDFGAVIPYKLQRLGKAARAFLASADDDERAAFDAFTARQAYWLEDYALFMAIKEAHGDGAWNAWPEELRLREEPALAEAREVHADAIMRQKVWQHFFDRQWRAVKDHANASGIRIVGDIPIFIAYDSADAWANPELFHIDEAGDPTVVAGVPPDYFSETGQRWGNPLYRWKRMEENGYAWWIRRFASTLEFVDIVRVDHFRGFEAYWEIPASEPTAVKGRWVRGPGQDFFDAVGAALGRLPIIAEDLGVITPEVDTLRTQNDLPGMKVLQFAFAGDASDPYLPHNYERDFVAYTGTHDNDTTTGWYRQAPEAERDYVRRYLARGDENISWEFIRLAQRSVADVAIFPLQDALGLGSEARMNTPGTAAGNWTWRFTWDQLGYWLAPALEEMAVLYGRAGSGTAQDTPYRQSATGSAVEEG